MAETRVALFPGAFDPPTLGHLDVIRRARDLCDRLVVAVGDNPAKTHLLPAETRVALLRDALAGAGGIEVAAYTGLTVDFAREVGASLLVRGLRRADDFGHEQQLALMNRAFAGIETVFVLADASVSFISSHLVRQVAAGGGDISGLVPPNVAEALAGAGG